MEGGVFEATLEIDCEEDEDVWMFAFSHLESSMSPMTRLSILIPLPTIVHLHLFQLEQHSYVELNFNLKRDKYPLHGNINSV